MARYCVVALAGAAFVAAVPAGTKPKELTTLAAHTVPPEEPPMHHDLGPMRRTGTPLDGSTHYRLSDKPMKRTAKPFRNTPPPPPPLPFGKMETTGSCVVKDGHCVESPNYPESYFSADECRIWRVPALPLDVQKFDVEWPKTAGVCDESDYFKVDGVSYCGTSGPDGVIPLGGTMHWKTDGSKVSKGWRICVGSLPPPPPAMPPPPPVAFGKMKVERGSCISDGVCVMSPGYPAMTPNHYDYCKIVKVPAAELDVRSFTINSHLATCGIDAFTIDGKDFCGTKGPDGVVPMSGMMEWETDGLGAAWKMCLGPSPPPPPMLPPPPSSPPDGLHVVSEDKSRGRNPIFTISTTDPCQIDYDTMCIMSPGFPGIYKDLDRCTFKNVPSLPIKIMNFTIENALAGSRGKNFCYDSLKVCTGTPPVCKKYCNPPGTKIGRGRKASTTKPTGVYSEDDQAMVSFDGEIATSDIVWESDSMTEETGWKLCFDKDYVKGGVKASPPPPASPSPLAPVKASPPPPASPSPLAPGKASKPVHLVKFNVTLAMDETSFKSQEPAFRQAVAAAAVVDVHYVYDIAVVVMKGSILVKVSIKTYDTPKADIIASKLDALMKAQLDSATPNLLGFVPATTKKGEAIPHSKVIVVYPAVRVSPEATMHEMEDTCDQNNAQYSWKCLWDNCPLLKYEREEFEDKVWSSALAPDLTDFLKELHEDEGFYEEFYNRPFEPEDPCDYTCKCA